MEYNPLSEIPVFQDRQAFFHAAFCGLRILNSQVPAEETDKENLPGMIPGRF
jgi:hypothetical protein